MVINIKIDNKNLYLILAIIALLAGIGYVVAGSGNPSLHGHPLDELGLPACSEGQVLKKTATGWACANPSRGESYIAYIEIDKTTEPTGPPEDWSHFNDYGWRVYEIKYNGLTTLIKEQVLGYQTVIKNCRGSIRDINTPYAGQMNYGCETYAGSRNGYPIYYARIYTNFKEKFICTYVCDYV